MANATSLHCQLHGPIATVTFDRPDERNSLSTNNLIALDRLLDDLFSRFELRVIIFTGVNGAFLAGADIRELTGLDESTAREFAARGQRVIERIAGSSLTTIAAINGFCLGGGLDFALACDIRIAAPNAVFAHPGAQLGIITGWGGTQRLPRLIGKNAALNLLLTARRISSAEALRIGLISRIEEPVLAAAVGVAENLVANPS